MFRAFCFVRNFFSSIALTNLLGIFAAAMIVRPVGVEGLFNQGWATDGLFLFIPIVLIFYRPQNVFNLVGVGASFCVWAFIYLYKLRDFSFEELKELYFFQSDFLDTGLVVCTFVIILVKELIEAFASSWANGVSIKFYNCIDRFWWRLRAK